MTSVMIVEDNKNLQRIYKNLLALKGLDIMVQAFDGKQAVEMFQTLKNKPEVIIMDQRMPRMNGVKATREIKQIDPRVRVIFLCADDAAKKEAVAVGADLFLVKPMSFEMLYDLIVSLSE